MRRGAVEGERLHCVSVSFDISRVPHVMEEPGAECVAWW